MNNFEFQCATKMIFGKDVHQKIGKEIKKYGATKILLVYGGNSIKKSGLYDVVTQKLNDENLTFLELSGVVPNPRVSLVRKGIEICRKENVDFLLAVGGGSVIDTCKAISFGVFYSGDVWDLIMHKAEPSEKHLPVADILTLPAAGSEESDSCMISDENLLIKSGFGSPYMRPVFSIMNPELTFTLPLFQTACGCMDIMSHTMERYFSQTEGTEMTDRMAEGIIKTVLNNFEIVMDNPTDYDARAEIMLCGTWAQNDMIGSGREQDWFNHGLEHQISGYYDIAHGAGLAITTPAWMEFLSDKQECIPKLLQYADRVWNIEINYKNPQKAIKEAAKKLRNLMKKAGLPLYLHEVGIGTDKFELMADNMTDGGIHTCGSFYKMSKADILTLLNMML